MRDRQGRRAHHGLALLLTTIAVLAWASPAVATSCTDLQAALDGSSGGDTIALDPGATCDSSNSVLPFTLPAHAITLDGNGATIDGEGATQAMTGTDLGTTTIRNFTFRNGHSMGGGGAVAISGSGSPVFENLAFYGNSAAGSATGGALVAGVDGDVTLDYSRFGDGTAPNANGAGYGGGGANLQGANVTVRNTTFDANNALYYGGGLLAYGAASLTVIGSTFAHNVTGSSAGGASLSGGEVVMTGNHFTANHVTPGAGGNYGEGAGATIYGGQAHQLTSTGNTFDGN